MDGKLVDWHDAKVHILTHTLHYGNGVFEGIRAYETDRGAAVFRLTLTFIGSTKAPRYCASRFPTLQRN